MPTPLQAQYKIAVEQGNYADQVQLLVTMAEQAIARQETLAAPRLVEEAWGLVHSKHRPFTGLSRANISAKLVVLWAKSGVAAHRNRDRNKDASKYWFFHT